MKLVKSLIISTLLAAATGANAVPMLKIWDGSTTITVVDGGVGDLLPGSGQVGTAAAIGNWWLNLVVGFGHDVLGDQIHLGSLNASNPLGGTVWVALTDTDFTNSGANPLNFGGGIGGAAAGSVQYWMYVDDSNTPFGEGTLIGTGSGSGAFSGSFSDWASVTGTYSMTLKAKITHGWSNYHQVTSLDFVGRVPEPATLALLGIGLAGIGFAARRREKR
jgi:hypothetical protein